MYFLLTLFYSFLNVYLSQMKHALVFLKVEMAFGLWLEMLSWFRCSLSRAAWDQRLFFICFCIQCLAQSRQVMLSQCVGKRIEWPFNLHMKQTHIQWAPNLGQCMNWAHKDELEGFCLYPRELPVWQQLDMAYASLTRWGFGVFPLTSILYLCLILIVFKSWTLALPQEVLQCQGVYTFLLLVCQCQSLGRWKDPWKGLL